MAFPIALHLLSDKQSVIDSLCHTDASILTDIIYSYILFLRSQYLHLKFCYLMPDVMQGSMLLSFFSSLSFR